MYEVELHAANVRILQRPCATEAEIIQHGNDADALLILNEPVTAHVLENLPKCRVASRLGIGVDAATRPWHQVTNVPGASVEEVSDRTVAMILALSAACSRSTPAFGPDEGTTWPVEPMSASSARRSSG
ncbi:Rossmann-fold NAD(P)-binding domain-containing protein [Prauserella flavalba]|uniref:hypothetical protein n=1 Tax=Prauserella flavalba TaxID=1477506 RepID=UPI0036EA98E4